MPKKITIFIPCYNRIKYIELALESAVTQDYENKNVVVMDDCSNDGSYEKLQELQKKWDFTLLRTDRPKRGTYWISNRIMEMFDTEYFQVLDSDDILLQKATSKLIEFMEKESAEIVGGQLILIDKNGDIFDSGEMKCWRPYNANFAYKIKSGQHLNRGGMIWKKRVIDKIGKFNDDSVCTMDKEFAIRALENGIVIRNMPFPILKYRIHKDSLSKSYLFGIENKERTANIKYLEKKYPDYCHLKEEYLIFFEQELNLVIDEKRISVEKWLVKYIKKLNEKNKITQIEKASLLLKQCRHIKYDIGINPEFLSYFEIDGQTPSLQGNKLCGRKKSYEIKNGIPYFVEGQSYCRGNFSLLHKRCRYLQLDSRNKTGHRYYTILKRTNWPTKFFKGKTVLECGCGAGPDTEILVRLGCRVIAVDIEGADIAKKNLKYSSSVQFVQDDIANLHLKKKSFDIVFCHRVLQHTPDPEKTLAHILQFVKEDGAVFVHCYADQPRQKYRWKYFLRPLTTRIKPQILYWLISISAKPLFILTNWTQKYKWGKIFNHYLIPFCNYRSLSFFTAKDDDFIIEYGIHDTFDALSPHYDHPLKPQRMETIAKGILKRPFEIVADSMKIFLRTKV